MAPKPGDWGVTGSGGSGNNCLFDDFADCVFDVGVAFDRIRNTEICQRCRRCIRITGNRPQLHALACTFKNTAAHGFQCGRERIFRDAIGNIDDQVIKKGDFETERFINQRKWRRAAIIRADPGRGSLNAGTGIFHDDQGAIIRNAGRRFIHIAHDNREIARRGVVIRIRADNRDAVAIAGFIIQRDVCLQRESIAADFKISAGVRRNTVGNRADTIDGRKCADDSSRGVFINQRVRQQDSADRGGRRFDRYRAVKQIILCRQRRDATGIARRQGLEVERRPVLAECAVQRAEEAAVTPESVRIKPEIIAEIRKIDDPAERDGTTDIDSIAEDGCSAGLPGRFFGRRDAMKAEERIKIRECEGGGGRA